MTWLLATAYVVGLVVAGAVLIGSIVASALIFAR
jgi:hypothetical protein